MNVIINNLRMHVHLAGSGPPLLLLHGFTGSAATWEPLLLHVTPRRRVIAPDLIGHGGSGAPADPARYRMERCVADLPALLDALDVAQVDLLGYSMGGRIALHLALAAPQRVRRLLLESASPGLADPDERAARVQSDNDLADAIERDGIAAFVAYWERLPLFAGRQTLPPAVREKQRAQRLQNRPTGLANSLRGMGTGQQESLWERLAELTLPVRLLVGAQDRKYCDIARRMEQLLPAAQVSVVADAGHTIHLEQPDRFAQLVGDFLAEPGIEN
jgi:2-succinyl-6-hydroxy-2,4-cyclohexadiene-1-carboxylate synthase